MADTPVWVQLVTPVITAVATWVTTKFEVLSVRQLKQYEGNWYAYYRDPDDASTVQEEIWEFSTLGSVKVRREGRLTFKGRLSLKGGKAYMNVDSVRTADERLFVMLESPTDPRGGERASICLWLGKEEMSRSLLNIAKRPLPRLTLRGVGLTSKDAVS